MAKLQFSEKEIQQIKNKLIQFATKFWAVKNTGDFNERQIAFDGAAWVLLDYGYMVNFISEFSSTEHIFESFEVEGEYGKDAVMFSDEKTVLEIGKEIARA